MFAGRKRNHCKSFLSLILALAMMLALVFAGCGEKVPAESAVPGTLPSEPTETQTDAPTDGPTDPPTEPPVIKTSTATVVSTGDLLMHESVVASGLDEATGKYSFDYIFKDLAPFIKNYDYAVANLEVTLAGSGNGYQYSGYPRFNCPDAIVDAAKNAGFDLLLTANNHSNDTKTTGFHRTQQIIADCGLDHIGSRPSADMPNYIVKDINGIKIGMICYTYNTGVKKGQASLNGIPLTAEDTKLINTFSYDQLDKFYKKLDGEIGRMKKDGAEAIMVYLHWGNEYHTRQNSWQEKISQALCNLGVDVIVGGHPHVIQPMDTYVSQEDPKHTMVCLYSMGNCVSNIRHSSTRPAECEDGLLFGVTFAKYSDGSVIVEKADILPYYVNKHYDSHTKRNIFPIVPLAGMPNEWKVKYGLDADMLDACQLSLNRTNAIVKNSLDKANNMLKAQQKQLETELGILK